MNISQTTLLVFLGLILIVFFANLNYQRIYNKFKNRDKKAKIKITLGIIVITFVITTLGYVEYNRFQYYIKSKNNKIPLTIEEIEQIHDEKLIGLGVKFLKNNEYYKMYNNNDYLKVSLDDESAKEFYKINFKIKKYYVENNKFPDKLKEVSNNFKNYIYFTNRYNNKYLLIKNKENLFKISKNTIVNNSKVENNLIYFITDNYAKIKKGIAVEKYLKTDNFYNINFYKNVELFKTKDKYLKFF